VISAVLDTNVLAAAFVGFRRPDSTARRLLQAWRDDRFSLVVSEHIIGELIRTLERPYFRQRLSPAQRSHAVSLLLNYATVVTPVAFVSGVAAHPEDDLILSTAVSSAADYLVTGDKQLLALGQFSGLQIVSVAEFARVLGE
jgi:uncharacterized protein